MVKRFLLNNVCDECGMVPTDEPRGFVPGQDYDAIAARLAEEVKNKKEFERDWLSACDDLTSTRARLAEAERLMAAAMRNGDFVSDNVLYVYGDDFNAMARFLGRTLREICAGKADSATPASSGDATKAMLAGSASGVQK